MPADTLDANYAERIQTFINEALDAALLNHRQSGPKSPVPREGLLQTMTRRALACAWGLKPNRIGNLPFLAKMLVAHYTTSKAKRSLPNPDQTVPGEDGLCGIVSDTSVATLMAGLRKGLYPMGHVAPMKWWSPEERCVVFPNELKIEKNLARRLRNAPMRMTFDQAPLEVMQQCAAPRSGRLSLTWITPDMMRAAMKLFEAGHMHSVEVWDEDNQLVGGLYGFAVGRVFSIESQFHTKRDTSKMATVALLAHLTDWGFAAADGKRMTGHLKAFGFKNVTRSAFRAMLSGKTAVPQGRWHFDPSLDLGRWKPAASGPARKPTAKA